MDVAYAATPTGGGSEVSASVSVRPGGGLFGRVAAEATAALLRAGALGLAVDRIARLRHRLIPLLLHPAKGTAPCPCSIPPRARPRPARPPWPSRPAPSPAATATASPPSTRCAASPSTCPPASSPRSWGRRAPASRRSCTCSPGSTGPTRAPSRSRGEEISAMADRRLTKLRRRHIGFVFQSFNLLPTLTAEENIVLPLDDRPDQAAARRGRRAAGPGRPRASGATTRRPSCRAASSSAWPSPAR